MEEKEQVYKLQADILSAKSRKEVKQIRTTINEILEYAKARYNELNIKNKPEVINTGVNIDNDNEKKRAMIRKM